MRGRLANDTDLRFWKKPYSCAGIYVECGSGRGVLTIRAARERQIADRISIERQSCSFA